MFFKDPQHIINISTPNPINRMRKLFLVAILAALFALSTAQPDARKDINGTEYTSSISDWTCVITFLKQNQTLITESLNSDDSDISRSDFSDSDITTNDLSDSSDFEDQIDAVAWNGTACNCWIILFEDEDYNGNSLGLWTTNSTQGSYDLTTFNYLEDSDIITDDDYKQWNQVVSSYRIYCF